MSARTIIHSMTATAVVLWVCGLAAADPTAENGSDTSMNHPPEWSLLPQNHDHDQWWSSESPSPNAIQPYARVVNATVDGDGSEFNGEEDWFIDIAIPLSAFHANTGLTSGDTFRVVFSTSTSHESDNKDRPDYDGWSDPIPPSRPPACS